jgi:linoleoyl-CoA desaturase
MGLVLPPLSYAEAGEADFHRVLNERAQTYLVACQDHRFANGRRLFKAAFLAVACIASYLLALQQDAAPAFVGAYVAAIFFCMLLNIDVNHDASHNVFLRSRLANRVVGRLVTLLLGIDPDYWRVRHTDYHHLYPNIEHYDLDTEENGFFRQTPFQRWRPHMRQQHRYWPLMAAMSLPYIAWVFDWQDHLRRTALREKNLLPGLAGWLLFIASKLGHLTLALIIPLYAAQAHGLGWPVVILTYLAAQMAASLFVVFLLLGTHWAQASFYQAPADGVMAQGWYAHNFATACDWFPEPRWLQWIMGGLNLHLTHHLFPGWHHRHYEALAAIVAATAEEFGLPYRCLGYRQLLRAQQEFLQSMGRAPETAC